MRLSLLLAWILPLLVSGSKPVRNLSVTLRGKKFDIDEATTVEEIKQEIKKLNDGKDDSIKSDILFDGKRLKSKDILNDVGVEDGAALNMVPKISTNKKKSSASAAAAVSGASISTSTAEASSSAGGSSMMEDYMKQAGIDTDKLNDFMSSMGGNPLAGLGGAGGSGGEGGMPDMKESMEMMGNMMNSPMFQDYMKDPERLEQSRQMILSNPMLKSMMGSMPGMEDLLNDKDAWRESMQAAAEMYQNMDTSQLMQAMMGNMPGGVPPGMPGAGPSNGLFDGTLGGGADDNKAAQAALDELSESED